MSQAKAARCGPCNKPVKDNDSTAIGCEKCSAWFHGQCVGLSPDDVATMGKIRGCFWLCSGCLEGNIFTSQAKFELIIQRQESLIEITKSIKETVENVDPTKTTSSNVPVNSRINNSCCCCCCCWGFTALLLGFLVPASSLKQCPLVSARDTITE